jgi:flagellar hook-length control protein FliK
VPLAAQAQAGGHDGAGSGANPGGPMRVPRGVDAGGPARGAAAATEPGAVPGVFSAASSASAGPEAGPLSGAAAAQAQAGPALAGSGASAPVATGVAMQDMIESIRATIEIAARQGATQARIALHPEDLGHISIRLSQTSQGLLARVSAETPAAAQALMSGRAELHQSLSSLGLSLLRLDISSFGQSETGDREGRFAGSSERSSASSTAGGEQETESLEALGELAGAAAPAPIAGGALVDVLA